MPNPSTLLPAKMVCELLGGITTMTLYRWINNPELNFPAPVVINRLRYWRQEDIADFQARSSKADGKAA